MTTPAAANLYLAQHLLDDEGRKVAVYNPRGVDPMTLPIIYGFNNGGMMGLLQATLITEDGTWIGGHACSHEGYMRHDLGILEGTRPDRHETFRTHYPNGYRMEFVGYSEAGKHPGLRAAWEKAEVKRLAEEAAKKDPA